VSLFNVITFAARCSAKGVRRQSFFDLPLDAGRWVYTLYHKDPASKRVFTLVLRKAITRLDGVSPYQGNVNPQTGSTNWPPMKFRILSGSMAMGSFVSARR
jgi:hypothetical protein